MTPIERYRGSLLGLAIGDALGTTVEFQSPGSFEPIADIVGGGPFHLEAGEWTDDTSMALCLAESLVECRGFDARDQMQRYVRWWRHGHLSSNGRCFDIGTTVRQALVRFENGEGQGPGAIGPSGTRRGEAYCGSDDPRSAGNGSIMRLAPVPLFFAADARLAIQRAADSSRTTHGALECIDACRYQGALIVGALRGEPKEGLLADHFEPALDISSFEPISDRSRREGAASPMNVGMWQAQPLAPAIAAIASGSFKTRNPPEIRGTGYVVQSLEAALWAFQRSTSFRDGALLAVNLGDDADTTGAVYGQLAGAFYGERGLPVEWIARLRHRELIVTLAEKLFALSTAQFSPPFA